MLEPCDGGVRQKGGEGGREAVAAAGQPLGGEKADAAIAGLEHLGKSPALLAKLASNTRAMRRALAASPQVRRV